MKSRNANTISLCLGPNEMGLSYGSTPAYPLFSETMPTGESGSQWLSHLSSVLHSKGMYLEIQPFAAPDSSGVMQNIYYNVGGAGDSYISTLKSIVSAGSPDIVNVVSEPSASYDNSLLSAYISFCTKAVDQMRQVEPSLTVGVMSIPWWDANTLVAAGGIHRSNIIYIAHCAYYAYDDNYASVVACGINWEADYWNGNLAVAKTEYYNWLNTNGESVIPFVNAGYSVMFEAIGGSTQAPNILQFTIDSNAWLIQHNISFIESYVPNSNYPAIYNSDGTISSIGQALFANLPS